MPDRDRDSIYLKRKQNVLNYTKLRKSIILSKSTVSSSSKRKASHQNLNSSTPKKPKKGEKTGETPKKKAPPGRKRKRVRLYYILHISFVYLVNYMFAD